MSMPRSQYQSYGKRGQHHHQRGNSVPSHSHHSQLQRQGSLPTQQAAQNAAPVAAASAEAAAPPTTSNELTTQTYSNYDQVVRFAQERWASVEYDLINPPEDPNRRVAYYVEKEPNPKLKDFVPFDLEAFCERQRLKKMQQQPPPSQ